MNWERKLSGLREPMVKRIRKSGPTFSAAVPNAEVPLDAPVPKHGGYCLRSLPYDYLCISGTTEEGKEETFLCGLYSADLLKAIREHIDKHNSEPSVPPPAAHKMRRE